MPKNLRAGAFVLAILISVLVFSLGCGGGDTTIVNSPTPPDEFSQEFRIDAFSIGDGGKIIHYVEVTQGYQKDIELGYQYREYKHGAWGPWLHVSGETTINTITSPTPSGDPIPNIGLSGSQWLLRLGVGRIEFRPPAGGHLGMTRVQIVAPKASTYLDVRVVSGGNPPPPPQGCRDEHPTKEAINGFWWDCINGDWVNTGVPVDNPPPPVTYSLHIYGAQGEFTEGGTINIDEGNGYQLQVWELTGSDGSKVTLDGSTATMDSPVLPFWCWDSIRREIMTVLWASPDYPDPEEPGNIFINPGTYDVKFTTSHVGKQYCRSGSVAVLDRPDFP